MNKQADKLENKLEKLIKQAVKRVKKETYGRYAVAVSGGLDSGLLTAMLKPHRPLQRIVTVKLPYGERYDERRHLDLLMTSLGLETPIKIILDESKFEKTFERAVKIIGRPIPHFNIFPLYTMYWTLNIMGIKNVILGDGPDESMCGYTRHLIMNYLYKVWGIEAFGHYKPTISKILPIDPAKTYFQLIGKKFVKIKAETLLDFMCEVDIKLMRPDMHEMADKLATHFGIKNHRPYEYKELDNFMFNLPADWKIDKTGEYGKYLLRIVAEKYLPRGIAWNKHKVGGPLVPVNKIMGWENTEGEFGKKKYIRLQREILDKA